MGDRLPPSAKLVLGYMYIEYMSGRVHLTINDLAKALGLSERRLRSVLGVLRERGYLEAYIDPSHGRRILYRLSLQNFYLDSPAIEPGFYILECGNCALPWDLTLRQYAIIRATALLLVHPAFKDLEELVKLTKCTCKIEGLNHESLRRGLELARGGYAVSAIGHFGDDVDRLIEAAKSAGVKYAVVRNMVARRGIPARADA
nr:MAG: hypothetical protein TU35_06950 [Thermoproteus sp. AZ2]